MIFLLLSLISCKANKATTRNFAQYLTKRPFSFVLFTSQKCQPCKRVQNLLDTMSTKYRDDINFIFVENEDSQQLFVKYKIDFIPQIDIFRGNNFIKFYDHEWNQNGMSAFIRSLLDEDISYLNNTFSIFDFQNQGPANLIISSPELANKADGLFMNYGGAFHIGVVDNQEIAKSLQLPPALFTRPYGEMSLPIDSFDDVDLLNLSKSPFEHLHNSETVGNSATEFTFMALIDERDPLHIADTIKRMQLAREFFGENLSFQFCDFFTCTNVVQQLGLISFMNPCYLIHQKAGTRVRLEPFRKMANSPEDVLNWLKFQVLGIEMPKEKEEIKIPRLYAHDFIPMALDPHHDVILLVAATGMQLYDESVNNFRILMTLFKHIKTVKFYEFNRFTEHVQGLELPQSDKPLLSIWPATSEPRGSSFGAYLSIPVILENLLKLITTEIDEYTLQDMTETLQEILKEQAANAE
ncbi:hypothetical protein TRFO_18737 [Tritrichomonas foetus]|uniref:Thioredoxin domain-containing protein n=1 Tax=Tritrichomonas foetus TaxID=1144522 RepID=A0A1J4KKC6_9EUKA|nr:hypothetical protein TRFO_18737 [Tritrichomonas foetus]|eukprot:OHT11753.1 hypothetical protein TRFO_18737 [Tritrichomonas foetus]